MYLFIIGSLKDTKTAGTGKLAGSKFLSCRIGLHRIYANARTALIQNTFCYFTVPFIQMTQSELFLFKLN